MLNRHLHPHPHFRPAARALALEPRILFDGAAAVAADHAASGAEHHPAAERGNSGNSDSNNPTPEAAAQHHGDGASGNAAAAILVVIDARVADYQSLLPGLPANAIVRIVGSEESGLAAVGQTLAEGEKFDAIHIISHGTPGNLTLGSDHIDGDSLATQGAQLQAWAAHLSADADILLYGCDIAAGAAGQTFLTEFAHLTSADVAASTDPTGAVAKGGDWVLERSTGTIESAALSVDGYDALLAATAITDANATTPRTTAEDTPLSITGISVTDADNPANMTVRLQTTGGFSNVTLNGTTVSAGTNGSADFTISGSQADINNTLGSLTFTNELNKNSSTSGYTAKIDLTATDVSNGGSNTLSVTNIAVTAANDAPDLSTKTDLTVNEGGSAAFSLAQLASSANALDVDILTGQQLLLQQMVQIKSLPGQGTLTYKNGPVVIDSVIPVSDLANLVYTHSGSDLAAPVTDTFNVAVSDGGGAVTNGTLGITLNPVNKAPAISGAPTLYEGQSKSVAPTIDLGDTADTLDNSAITISNVVTGIQGSFFIDANGNGVIDGAETAFTGGTLTAAQLAQFKFIQNGYEPNTPSAVSPSYKISVQDFGGRSDGTGTQLTTEKTITLTVLPNNDQPVVDHITPPVAPVNERGYLTITTAMLQVTDPDLNPADPSLAWPAANLVYTVEQLPTYGQLLLEVSTGVWKSLDVGGRFTQADINGGKVKYYQMAELTGTELVPEKFTFTVRDSAYGYELPTPDNLGAIVPGAVREGNVATGAIKTLEFAFNLIPVDGTGGGTSPTYDGMTYLFDELGTNFNGSASGWTEGNVENDGVITQAMLKYEITRTIGGTAVCHFQKTTAPFSAV